jgi:hypothetical protein
MREVFIAQETHRGDCLFSWSSFVAMAVIQAEMGQETHKKGAERESKHILSWGEAAKANASRDGSHEAGGGGGGGKHSRRQQILPSYTAE